MKQLTALLCTLLVTAPLPAQTGTSPDPAGQQQTSAPGGPLKAFRYREEPPINLSNSGRLDSLLRAGKIYLSLQDAIALALENNLDIELSRYGPRLADADILRARTGSSSEVLHVPSAVFQPLNVRSTGSARSRFLTEAGKSSLICPSMR